jgi:hypothetical protein
VRYEAVTPAYWLDTAGSAGLTDLVVVCSSGPGRDDPVAKPLRLLLRAGQHESTCMQHQVISLYVYAAPSHLGPIGGPDTTAVVSCKLPNVKTSHLA